MKGGELIREARRRAGLSQDALARRLATKQPVIARWESGRRSPTYQTVVKAVRACGFELHVGIAAPDRQADADITERLQMSPTERIRANQRALRSERWARSLRQGDTRGRG